MKINKLREFNTQIEKDFGPFKLTEDSFFNPHAMLLVQIKSSLFNNIDRIMRHELNFEIFSSRVPPQIIWILPIVHKDWVYFEHIME